jgi:hypothetical protein
MRHSLVIEALLLGGFAALPAALWAQTFSVRTTGSVALSLKSGRGLAVIRSHGALLGRVKAGRVVVTPNVVVRCWRYRTRLASGMIRYRGVRQGCTFITFRVFSGDGTWRVRIRGRGINVSGVVRGSLALDGADTGRRGTYSIAGRPYRSWPRTLHRFALVR